MTMNQRTKGRLQFLLIGALFLGPLIAAAWLYFAGQDLQPEGRTNHGALLDPIVSLPDTLPESPLHAHNDAHWLLVYVNEASCDAACELALYTVRQSRLMLGREMDRVVRVFLHGPSAPDTVLLAREHAGLVVLQDAATAAVLLANAPPALEAGGFFLVDPLGNLVMYFPPGVVPGDMVDDIKRLLKLSRIG